MTRDAGFQGLGSSVGHRDQRRTGSRSAASPSLASTGFGCLSCPRRRARCKRPAHVFVERCRLRGLDHREKTLILLPEGERPTGRRSTTCRSRRCGPLVVALRPSSRFSCAGWSSSGPAVRSAPCNADARSEDRGSAGVSFESGPQKPTLSARRAPPPREPLLSSLPGNSANIYRRCGWACHGQASLRHEHPWKTAGSPPTTSGIVLTLSALLAPCPFPVGASHEGESSPDRGSFRSRGREERQTLKTDQLAVNRATTGRVAVCKAWCRRRDRGPRTIGASPR